MANKQNDWLATLLFQPEMSIEDFNAAGITPENTTLQDKEYYKNLNVIKEAFANSKGDLDEKAFNSFYDSALLLYNDYANKQTLGVISDNYKFDPFDWRYNEKPVVDINAKLSFEKNPMRYSTNIKAMNTITPSNYSIREIAQTNRVYDFENDKWLDWSPNDKGGFIKGLFRDSLVLATWDTDGTHEENGRLIEHKKGEYKYDPITGRPYYETLGNREIYDKDVLHYADTFTKEGTAINKWDFFDSDGLDKSVGGSIMKMTAAVAPTLLGLIAPPIGLIYGGVSAAIALSQLMPTLGKAINGFVTNDNQNSELGKTLNTLEAITSRFASSVSDHSREKTVTIENAAALIKDVALQLFQQRSIQYIPRLFKNNPKIYNNANLARTLSYAYMSGTSALDSYSAFKQAGADDRTASLGMMATIAAFYKLMSLDYFRDSFFKGSWFDDNNVKSPMWKVAEDFMTAIKEPGSKIGADVAENTVAANQRTFRAMTKRISDAIQRVGKPWKSSTFLERSFAEGVEETMEELFQDGIKGSFLAAEALGIPMNKQKENLDFGYSAKDVLTRYGMSFFGGFVGGAIFQGYNSLEARGAHLVNNDSDAHLAEMVKLIADGRTEEIKDILSKWHDKKRFGSGDLSGTKISVVSNIEGDTNTALAKSDKDISQNDFVYNALLEQVNYIDRVLTEEGFKDFNAKHLELLKSANPYITESEAAGISMRELGLHSLVLKDVNRIASEVVKLRAKLDERKATFTPSNDTTESKEAAKTAQKNDTVIKDLESRLKEIRSERDAIKNGERDDYYVSQYSLVLNSAPLIPFLGFSEYDSFVRARYGKNSTELSTTQDILAKEEYEKYKNGDKADTFIAIDAYNAMSQEFAKSIEKAEKQIGDSIADSDLETSTIGSAYFENLKAKESAETRIEELSKKETLTEEETNELSDLREKVSQLTQQITSLRRNPKRSLFNATSNPTALIKRIQKVLNQETITIEDVDNVAKELKQAYKTWGANKTLKRTESELQSFMVLLNRASLTKEQRLGAIKSWLEQYREAVDDDINTALYEITKGDYDADLFLNWDGSNFKPIHNKFISLVDDFYNNLNNPVEALRIYNELKNLLLQNGMTEEEVNHLLYSDMGNGSLMPRIGNDTVEEFLSEIIELQSNIKRSTTPELLKDVGARLNDTDISSILEMLESEQNRVASVKDLDDYVIANPQVRVGLKNALLILNALKGVIKGASDGTNVKINKFKKNSKFAEISKESAELLMMDLDEFINRIGFLLKLDAKNNGFKLREHKDIAINMHLKFLHKLTDAIHSEPFRKEFSNNELEVDPAKLWEEFEPIGFENISPDNFEEYEPVIIRYEAELFNRVKQLGFTDEQIVQKIMNIFGEDTEIWKQNSTRLSKDEDVIVTDYDFAFYLLSTLILNSNDFYVKLKGIVNDKFDKAPLYGHEYIVKMAYAMMLNPNAFNSLVDKIADTYKGSDTYIQAKRRLHNILFGFGGAGTGKSTSVALLFKELVKDLDSEFIYLASEKNQVSKLVESVKAENSEKRLTFKEFFDKIAPDQFNTDNITINEDSTVETKKPLSFNDYLYHSSDSSIKVIICDEIETLNELQLDLLSKYAEANNIIVLGLGDYKQPTPDIVSVSGTTVTRKPSSFEDLYFIKTPSLGASLRTLSVAKNDNYNKLDILLDSIVNDVWNDPEKYLDPQERNKLIDNVVKDGVVLNYYEYGNRIVGDRILSDESEFKKKIDLATSIGGGTRVCIVYDESTKSKYQGDKYNSENVIAVNIDDALGGEFDYVFVDTAFDKSNKFHELQKFYMLTQRSTLYTGVLDVGKNYENILKIKTTENKASGALMVMNQDTINDFKQWRLKSLSSLVASSNYEANLKPKTYTVKPKQTKVISAPIESNPTLSNEEVPNGSNEEEPQSFQPEPQEQKLGNAVAVKTQDDEIELRGTANSNIKNDQSSTETPSEYNSVRDQFEQGKLNSEDAEFITAVVPNNSGNKNIDLNAYYKELYSPEFITKQINNPTSVAKLLLTSTNLSQLKRVYPKFIQSVQRIVYNANDLKNISTDLRSAVRILSTASINIAALQPYLEGPKEIRVIRNGITSDIVIRFYNNPSKSENFVDIPIGKTSILKEGVYTGGFTKESTTNFIKGERITIAELMKRYPALDIISDAGILMGDQVGNYTGSEEFAERNNGKAFIAVGELIGSMLGSEVFAAQTSRDTVWTYSYSDRLKLAGIQKTLNPEEVCKFLTCWSYIKFGIDSTDKNVYYVQNERINNLKHFGYFLNNNVDRTKVLSDLAKISGNEDWNEFDRLSDEAKVDLLNFGSYLATPATMGSIISNIISELINNPSKYQESNIWYNLRRLIGSANQALWIKTDTNKLYYVSTERNTKGDPIQWVIRDEFDNIISKTNYAGVVGSNLANTLNSLLKSVGINLKSSSALIMYKKEEQGINRWRIHNTNQVFNDLLAPFITNSDKINQIFSSFKQGFYANIMSTRQAPNGPWKLVNILSNPDLYTTDASTWMYSTYSINPDSIIGDVSSTQIDLIDEWEDSKKELKKVGGKVLDTRLIDQIISNYEKTFDIKTVSSATDLVTHVEAIVQQINNQIDAWTKTAFTKKLKWDPYLGMATFEYENTLNFAINNAINEIGLDSSTSEYIWKASGFDNSGVSVIKTSNGDAYVYVDDNGEVIAIKTNTGNDFAIALNGLEELLPNSSLESNPNMGRIKRLIINYLNNVVKDVVTVSEANAIATMFENDYQLNELINNYLENRLINNEC